VVGVPRYRADLQAGAVTGPAAAYRTDDGKWTFQGAIGKFNTVQEAEDAIRRMGMKHRYQGFEASPGYAFMRYQGTRAIDSSAAARGMIRSGATLKAQDAFGQGIAAQEYGTYLNRLASMAGVGQTSSAQTGALGVSTGGQIGANTMAAGAGSANALMAGGAARGSAYQNMGNQIGNFAGNALGAAAFGGYLTPGNSWGGQFSSGWRP
jgi:hypothetical protein